MYTALPFAALSTLQSSHREERGLQQNHMQVHFLYYFLWNQILGSSTCFGIINLIQKLQCKHFVDRYLYGATKSRIFYRTPAGYTAKKKTRRKRNRGCQELLSVAHQPLPPPPPSPPHRAPAALPGAALSGLAERRPPPSPSHPHDQKLVIFRKGG